MFGIAVQVQAVVPVRPADERKAVGTLMGGDKVKGTFQVFHKGNGCGHIIVKRNLLFQDRHISGLPDIGVYCSDEPQGIVVKAASDIGISLFGQRLVLVISAAVGELCGGNIQDTFSCPLRNQMEEAQEILAGIPKAHASADTGLIVGGGTGHIEGYHTLILVPDIHHTVHLIVGRAYLEAGQQLFPVMAQFFKSLVHSLFVGVFCQELPGFGFIDHIGSFPFFLPGIFCVSQDEDISFAFPRFQAEVQLVGGDRIPAAGYRICQLSSQHSLRSVRSPVGP